MRNSSSEEVFCNALLKFIRLAASKIYKINDPIGLVLLTRLHLVFRNLSIILMIQ